MSNSYAELLVIGLAQKKAEKFGTNFYLSYFCPKYITMDAMKFQLKKNIKNEKVCNYRIVHDFGW